MMSNPKPKSKSSSVGIDVELGNNEQQPTTDMESNTDRKDLDSVPLEVSARGLCYDVGKGKNVKTILKSVSAKFSSGELCALVGASGAGKSTLLNVLAGNNQRPYRGDILINGEPVPKEIRSVQGFIPQADVCYPALTPRQTLWYSALLRLPSSVSKNKKKAIVEDLLAELNLTHCADTIVGNEDMRGISGGEKKRVSIGTELIVNPAILWVDEPTSGLDSSSAENIVETLRVLANEKGRTVICTIHQPSWQVFQKFDKILLMHKGRVAYHGEARTQLVKYFTTIGYNVPAQENPLDFYMREMQNGENNDIFPDMWDKFENKEQFKTAKELINVIPSLSSLSLSKWKHVNSKWFQFRVLTQRGAHDSIKDKKKMLRGIAQKLMITLMIGIVFVDQAGPENAKTMSSSGALFFLVFLVFIDAVMKNVLELPLIKSLIAREYKNNAYDLLPFYLSQITVNYMLETINALLPIPAYFIIGYRANAEQVFIFILVLLLMAFIATPMGLMAGSIASDVKEAQSMIMPIVMPLMLFSGFVIPLASIQSYFVWLYHISFFQYALSALMINEYNGVEFTDCVKLPANSTCAAFQRKCFETGDEFLAQKELTQSDLSLFIAYLCCFMLAFVIPGFFVIRRQIIKASKAG